MRLVLLGPPGSGKGTLAKPLAEHFDALHIATGDLFRAEIAAETSLGRLANSFIAFGNLVPDEVTNELMRERLGQPEAERFVLDGYPRTPEQAEALEVMLEGFHRPLNAALMVDVPDDLIVERAIGRLICPNCGAIFHLKFKPPRVDGICDVCSNVLKTREDDKPSTVRHRLSVFHRTTAPVINFYRDRSMLCIIAGTGTPKENFQRAVDTLSSF